MINSKKIYNTLLSDSRLTSIIPSDNIFNSQPNEIEVFPCVIFVDENQSDAEYADNFSTASRCEVSIHIFTKKLDSYVTSSEISVILAQIFNEKLWHCSLNGEIGDPDASVEHRVMKFEKSIYNKLNINS